MMKRKRRVTLVLVTSINGLLTRGSQPSGLWASAEDQDFFEQIKRHSDVIIMGSRTYESVRGQLQLSSQLPRIVMTSRPEAYQSDEKTGVLEFMALAPSEVIETLHQRGHRLILVAGGARVAASFLESSLIDEIVLTLEPWYFAEGIAWVAGSDVQLRLLDVRQLNERGTLLLRYQVV